MRFSVLSASLAIASGVSGAALPQLLPGSVIAPALPADIFAKTPKPVIPVPLAEAKAIFQNANKTEQPEPQALFRTMDTMAVAATCANPRVRVEWDSYSNADRQAYTDAVRCLMSRAPSGRYPASKSKYEDLVALHQQLTPNVHSSVNPTRNNAKFLVWHRYFLWTFESLLQSECGFNRPIPWFDETRYAGRFAQSSIFSSQWYGGIALNSQCVRDGQFANLALNIGPGSGNQLHCLNRNGDGSKTANCNQAYVDQCNAYGDFAGMAACAESGPHAWGHNGVGAVMQDTYASPGDPFFFLHHAFVDRNYRIWQNANPSVRTTTINGVDINGNALTLDTTVNVQDIRPTVRISDILDTTSETLCYKYNY